MDEKQATDKQKFQEQLNSLLEYFNYGSLYVPFGTQEIAVSNQDGDYLFTIN